MLLIHCVAVDPQRASLECAAPENSLHTDGTCRHSPPRGIDRRVFPGFARAPGSGSRGVSLGRRIPPSPPRRGPFGPSFGGAPVAAPLRAWEGRGPAGFHGPGGRDTEWGARGGGLFASRAHSPPPSIRGQAPYAGRRSGGKPALHLQAGTFSVVDREFNAEHGVQLASR